MSWAISLCQKSFWILFLLVIGYEQPPALTDFWTIFLMGYSVITSCNQSWLQTNLSLATVLTSVQKLLSTFNSLYSHFLNTKREKYMPLLINMEFGKYCTHYSILSNITYYSYYPPAGSIQLEADATSGGDKESEQ